MRSTGEDNMSLTKLRYCVRTRGCDKYSTEHESSIARGFFGAAARLAGSLRPILARVGKSNKQDQRQY